MSRGSRNKKIKCFNFILAKLMSAVQEAEDDSLEHFRLEWRRELSDRSEASHESAVRTTVVSEDEARDRIAEALVMFREAQRLEDWDAKASSLIALNEGGKAYSETHFPVGWEGKVGSHMPVLSVTGDAATISVAHGMSTAHFIQYVWAVDGSGTVVYWREFNGTDASPAVATFRVGAGVGGLWA